MPVRLHLFDLGVVGLYLIAITLFGLRFARRGTTRDKSLRGYFLADRTVPWWAIALSIVSAETSTLTIIGTPGLAFAGDFGFLQIVIGYMLGRVVVAALFLPRYFQGEMLTAYQLIDRRFGRTLHKVTAGLFLLTRAAAEGVRVFAVSIVVSIAIGTGDVVSIAIISALTLLYTFEGGMAAVIWTDVVQMGIYIGGTIVAIWSLGQHVPGGWTHIHTVAAAAGKFHMLNFALNLTTTYTFWAGVLGGTFLTMASHGTDQLMVQRLLAARNLRESRLALLSSGVVIFLQFALFLLIGAGLFVFYGMHPAELTAIGAADGNRIFPAFIVHEMPVGIAGLLVAAILAAAMSNLSAALNSLSSTTVVDFWMGWRPAAADRERMIVSRLSTVFWAMVLFAVAVYSVHAGGKGNVVEIGLSIASVAYGCLLGVFLLGTLTRYATQGGAIVGMITGFAVNVWLWQGTFPKVILWKPGFDAARTLPNGQIIHDAVVPGLTIPHIAYTWYVLIGALVTFAVGLLASAVLPKRRASKSAAVAAVMLVVCLSAVAKAQSSGGTNAGILPLRAAQGQNDNAKKEAAPYDFSAASAAIDKAIGEKKLPGAVLLVGHGGKVVFEQAYGVRKYAGEPGLDGKPSAAEPMTVDTIFDMASLTKCLATATSVMELVEQGKIDVDAPVVKYLPEFGVNGKEKVTVRELLTHYSGLPPDVDLKDAWGLAAPDKAEGMRRAMQSKLVSTPGTHFEYSDINYITLGAIVEKISGETLDVYAQEHVFKPLGMTQTRFFPFDKACGADKLGATIVGDHEQYACPSGTWYAWGYREDIAPTQHDNEGTAETNPDFDHLLRGTVHDPTTRRMGGVAGQAGLFSTAEDVSKYAQALLDKLLRNTGPFPLKQSTLRLMTRPEQPATAENTATTFTADGQPSKGVALRGFGWDINSSYSRPRGSVFPTDLSPTDKTVPSFGHTGFTGTTLWIDPTSDSYVVLLSNSVHPRGAAPISPLRGEVATDVAEALGLAEIAYQLKDCDGKPLGPPITVEEAAATDLYCRTSGGTDCPGVLVCTGGGTVEAETAAPLTDGISPVHMRSASIQSPQRRLTDTERIAQQKALKAELKGEPENHGCGWLECPHVKTGIDVLEETKFDALKKLAAQHGGHLRIGLLTNQTGLDAQGQRTIDILRKAGNGIELVRLFSPEHGIFGSKDSNDIGQEVDPASGLKVTSLYGPKDADKRPKPEDLRDLDAVVIDLQDAGVRFYTYETVVGYFLEASACEAVSGHRVEIITLDRPALTGGLAVQGPVSDTATSYVNYMPEPLRNGMTLGELAQYMRAEHPGTCVEEPAAKAAITSPASSVGLKPHANPDGSGGLKTTAAALAHLTVIPMENWHRSEFYDETGVPWVNPSPNLRSVEAATLYPGLGMLDYSNVSVGRGTAMPFEVIGAGSTAATKDAAGVPAWFNGKVVADYLTARHIPGVTFAATTFAVAETAEKYPYHGQTIQGVRMAVTDRTALDSPELGIEILSALHHLYPVQFKLDKAANLVANTETMAAIARGDDPRAIAASWAPALDAFKARREKYLLYP